MLEPFAAAVEAPADVFPRARPFPNSSSKRLRGGCSERGVDRCECRRRECFVKIGGPFF
jgi:hypothetical protein